MAESSNAQGIQSEVLNTIRAGQTAVLDAVERLVATAMSMRPELPELPFADVLNITEKLPKPGDIVTGAYNFAEQVLASQREFAEGMVKATAPLVTFGSGAGDKGAAA
jgi:hypothetical protein